MKTLSIALIFMVSSMSSCRKSDGGASTVVEKKSASGSSAASRSNPARNESILAFRTALSQSGSDPVKVSNFCRTLEKLSDQELGGLFRSLDLISSKEDQDVASYVFMVLASRNPRLALDLTNDLPKDAKVLTKLSNTYMTISQNHPEIALQWLKDNNTSDSQHNKFAATCMLGDLSRINPTETTALVSSMSDSFKAYFLPLLMRGIAERDADLAVSLANANFKGDSLSAAMLSITTSVARLDLSKALSILDTLTGESAANCTRAVVLVMASEGRGDVAALLQKVAPKDIRGVLAGGGVVERLAAQNPSLAVDLFSSIPFTEANKDLFSRLAASLSEKDPSAALEFAKSLPPGPASKEVLGNIFASLAKNDPQAAISKVSTLDSNLQNTAYRSIVKSLALTDIEQAKIIAAHCDPVFQPDAYREIARQLTYANSQEAIKMLADPSMIAVLGDNFRSQMLDHTVRTWASKDLAGAQTWVENLPASDKLQGVQGLMTTWVKSDPIAASEWLGKLPSGAARDAGARIIVDQLRNTDPAAAEQWRKTITPTAPK